MNRIREIGFRTDATGYEGLSWYTRLRDEGQLDEHNKVYVPSYCFNWSDPGDMAGHKQSGDINNPNNFENHKAKSNDVSQKPLERCGAEIINQTYSKYLSYLVSHQNEFNSELWTKYIAPHLNK